MFFDPEIQKFISYCEEKGILVEETPINHALIEDAKKDIKVTAYIMHKHLDKKL